MLACQCWQWCDAPLPYGEVVHGVPPERQWLSAHELKAREKLALKRQVPRIAQPLADMCNCVAAEAAHALESPAMCIKRALPNTIGAIRTRRVAWGSMEETHIGLRGGG